MKILDFILWAVEGNESFPAKKEFDQIWGELGRYARQNIDS